MPSLMELLKIILVFLCGLIGSFFALFMAPVAMLSGYKRAGIWFIGIGVVNLVIAHWLNLSQVILLSLLVLNLAVFLALYVWTLPVMRHLPKVNDVSVNGVSTIEDAVDASQKTNLEGWLLVEYVQNLTARKFSYSRCNPWDSPARAFKRGMGYCQQQVLALHEIYHRLGIDSRVVHALKCKFPTLEVDGVVQSEYMMSHSWLKVQIENQELDVCPGNVNNRPGVVDFEILSPVRTLHAFLQPFTHLGSVIINMMPDRQQSYVLDLWMSFLQDTSNEHS